ncbi:hypothetical protein [Mobilicoccus pelagius]|uniref:hypothetical protein n=1 Tax=Mobilicoccus pelagius TaxID=746032 RepID=UPI00068F122E
MLGRPEPYDFSYLLSVTCLREDPEAFWEFYRTYLAYPDATPTRTHRALAALEQRGADCRRSSRWTWTGCTRQPGRATSSRCTARCAVTTA